MEARGLAVSAPKLSTANNQLVPNYLGRALTLVYNIEFDHTLRETCGWLEYWKIARSW